MWCFTFGTWCSTRIPLQTFFPTPKTLTQTAIQTEKVINGSWKKSIKSLGRAIESHRSFRALFAFHYPLITKPICGPRKIHIFLVPFLHQNRKYYLKEIPIRYGSVEQTHHGLFTFFLQPEISLFRKRKFVCLTMIMFAHHSWKSRRESRVIIKFKY